MSNAGAHRLGAAVVAALALGPRNSAEPRAALELLATACGGAMFGTLPDLLEPASHPNHRQFFHGFICAGFVGVACYYLYKWQPETDRDKAIRSILLVGGIAFLTHLAMDSFTPGGLPLLGRA